MSPEWKRRTAAITITFVGVFGVRMWERHLGWIGFDPVWITRSAALAFLILSFRLADRIPDHELDKVSFRWVWPRLHVGHGVFVMLVLIMFALLYGVAH